MKWTALIGVPVGSRSPDVASVKTIENVAVTERLSFIVTVHVVVVPLQAPLQPLKRAWVPGVAVSVTVVPVLKLAEQIDPQVIPAGLLIAVPPAEPRIATVNVTEVLSVNVAVPGVWDWGATGRGRAPLPPPPLHPPNAESVAGAAVNVTTVPLL